MLALFSDGFRPLGCGPLGFECSDSGCSLIGVARVRVRVPAVHARTAYTSYPHMLLAPVFTGFAWARCRTRRLCRMRSLFFSRSESAGIHSVFPYFGAKRFGMHSASCHLTDFSHPKALSDNPEPKKECPCSAKSAANSPHISTQRGKPEANTFHQANLQHPKMRVILVGCWWWWRWWWWWCCC